MPEAKCDFKGVYRLLIRIFKGRLLVMQRATKADLKGLGGLIFRDFKGGFLNISPKIFKSHRVGP